MCYDRFLDPKKVKYFIVQNDAILSLRDKIKLARRGGKQLVSHLRIPEIVLVLTLSVRTGLCLKLKIWHWSWSAMRGRELNGLKDRSYILCREITDEGIDNWSLPASAGRRQRFCQTV